MKKTRSGSTSSSNSSTNYEKYLNVATEANPSMILELDLNGRIRYISPIWNQIIETEMPEVGTSISDLIIGSETDREVFNEVMQMWMSNDSVSYTITFDIMGKDYTPIAMEACGILIHDSITNKATHSMWIMKPLDADLQDDYVKISSRLPENFIKMLGFGSYIFLDYLNFIQSQLCLEETNLPNPNLELCRVCEMFIPDWWLESHSKSCICEHRIESLVQLLQENLIEHCTYLYSITKENEKEQTSDNENTLSNNFTFEYKGYVSQVSPATIINLIDFCEVAIESNISQIREMNGETNLKNDLAFKSINESRYSDKYEFSPHTQNCILEITDWKLPFVDENNQGLNLLVEHTIKLGKDKIDAILRLDNAMTFSYRLKNEVNNYVSQLISEQIENNRLYLTHSMGSPIMKDNLATFDNNIENDAGSNLLGSSQHTITHTNLINNIHPEHNITENIVSPQSQRPQTGTLFADVYLNDDTIPNESRKNKSSNKNEKVNEKTQWITHSTESLSRSITPKQTLETVEKLSNTSSNIVNDASNMNLPSSSTESSVSRFRNDVNFQRPTGPPSRGSIITPGSFIVPKMKTSITITPRKGSPLLTASSSTSNMNALNQISRSSSINKNISYRSPLSSPRISMNNLMTPDQAGHVNSLMKQPLSPLLLATNPVKNLTPSIKDYDVIKPISKGAYGSVYLGRKKLTGDYVAIKVLRKSDMIAKNQVTNVKSERAIMMVQSTKPYVVNLYESFQNKDNLFLVMEYLPGGDLATVIKMMGYLPDNWVKQYISEIIIGVDDMHKNGIIHHDLKPENLLIDRKGHLKLTDFGLSRAGLVHRHQNRPPREKQLSVSSIQSNSSRHSNHNNKIYTHGNINSNNQDDINTTNMILDGILRNRDRRHSNSSSISNIEPLSLTRNDSSGSLSLEDAPRSTTPINPSKVQRRRVSSLLAETQDFSRLSDYALYHPNDSNPQPKFFGTPDYLAPETIRGTIEGNQCDWWSVGCILFEMYFGYPPFHDRDVEAVLENILSDEIHWPTFSSPEEEAEYISKDAKELINRFLTKNPQERLGNNGIEEIKLHPYFNDVNWDSVYEEEVSFVPNVEHPEDTDYFELRGAVLEDLGEDNDDKANDNIADNELEAPVSAVLSEDLDTKGFSNVLDERSSLQTPNIKLSISSVLEPDSRKDSDPSSPVVKSPLSGLSQQLRERRQRKLSDSKTEFGSFNYRNLVALDKANKDAINRLKNEHIMEQQGTNRRISTASIPSSSSDSSVAKIRQPRVSLSNNSTKGHMHNSSLNSDISYRSISPDRNSAIYTEYIPRKDSNSGSEILESQVMSVSNSLEDANLLKFKSPSTPIQLGKNNIVTSSPFASRPLSFSKNPSIKKSSEELTPEDAERQQAISRIRSVRNRRRSTKKNPSNVEHMFYKLDILLCEPIPIHRYYISKDLENLGCTVVTVGAGDELISRATSGVKFDLIITALKLPKLGAVDIVKLLKHTNGINSYTPVVAVTSYYHEASNTNIFNDVYEKPISLTTLKKLVSKYTLLKSQKEDEFVFSDNDTF